MTDLYTYYGNSLIIPSGGLLPTLILSTHVA
jgi:hypothetical protein